MLQSEFYERTHITLTAEEYADVECLYNAVKMDKDKFCKCWVSEKKNSLFKELAEAFCHEYRMHIVDINQLQANGKSYNEEINHLKAQVKELEATIQQEQERAYENFHNGLYEALNDLAGKIVRTSFVEKSVYDVIEEEFGLGFIIKTKHEAGIPLSNAEIDYMVGKL